MEPIRFPEDEQAHDCIIEWWYFNGHLVGEDGKRYSFMDCLFKAKVKEIEIPFLSRIPLKVVYFSHSIISDITEKRFYPMIDYLSIVSKDSFTKPLLFVNYIDPMLVDEYVNREIVETEPFHYRIKTDNMDLTMRSMKGPLLEGGTGFVKLGNKGSYYYSLTNLRTEGTIMVDCRPVKVTGKSWMDHQWADVKYSKDRWTWFSIQLDDDTEMVCYEYTNAKTDAKSYLAGMMHSDGTQQHTEDVAITPLKKVWTSSATKNDYPVAWKIEVPSWGLSLEVRSMIEDQEMVFGTINYWEGPLTVKGRIGNRTVTGQGFMELLGRPSYYASTNLVKDSISKISKHWIHGF